MNDFKNLYLILIISSVTILLFKSLTPQKEQFVGRLLGPLRALGRFASQAPDILGLLAEACVNFFANFVDLFVALFQALAWVEKIPDHFFNSFAYISTIISDLLILTTLWLNPITLIKCIIKLLFFIVKLVFNTIFVFIKDIFSYIGDKFLNGIKGSLWGVPHGPEQHIEHDDVVGTTGRISRTDLGIHGHHHEHGDEENLNHTYQPMRCYKGIGANGYINIVAMIICPPLGVFMSYGLRGIVKILICAGLTLLFYFPGLIYGLLITTHLGLGRDLKMSECDGQFAGLVITGCPKRKNEIDCKEATIPNKVDNKGNPVKACLWHEDPNSKYGGVCRNSHIRYKDYVNLKSKFTRIRNTVSGRVKENVSYLDPNDLTVKDDRYNMNANRGAEAAAYSSAAGVSKDFDYASKLPTTVDRGFKKEDNATKNPKTPEQIEKEKNMKK